MTKRKPHLLLPVPDLTITETWRVGDVCFHPAGHASELVAQNSEPRAESPSDSAVVFYQHVDGNAASLDHSTVAEVRSADYKAAYRQVADALAVLRLLQLARFPYVDTDLQTFSMPGEVTQYLLGYIDLAAGPAPGWSRGGAFPGWTFSAEDHTYFKKDIGLQFLSRALAAKSRSRLQQRGLLGARLLSTSILAQDPDQKLLNAVMAVEVLIGDRRKGPKTFRLARRHSFLACTGPRGSRCGRDRPACPYLALDPDNKVDKKALQVLEERLLAGDNTVRCSEYYGMRELYHARNGAVHDGSAGLNGATVRDLLFPISRWLIPQVYAWYATHPTDDDLQQLDDEIAATGAIAPLVETSSSDPSSTL